MADEQITLTHALIEAGASYQGDPKPFGWNRKQLELLGVKWPPIKGWKTRLHMRKVQVSKERYALFLALRGRESGKLF